MSMKEVCCGWTTLLIINWADHRTTLVIESLMAAQLSLQGQRLNQGKDLPLLKKEEVLL